MGRKPFCNEKRSQGKDSSRLGQSSASSGPLPIKDAGDHRTDPSSALPPLLIRARLAFASRSRNTAIVGVYELFLICQMKLVP